VKDIIATAHHRGINANVRRKILLRKEKLLNCVTITMDILVKENMSMEIKNGAKIQNLCGTK
jgi:hypothetical protein